MLSGVATDLLVYSIIVPVMPFQLERLGYHAVSALTGWLLFAYVCFFKSKIQLIAYESAVCWSGSLYVQLINLELAFPDLNPSHHSNRHAVGTL